MALSRSKARGITRTGGRAFYSSWFFFLKSALKEGVRVDQSVYRDWGSLEELKTISFNKWWEQTGRQLADAAQRRDAKVVSVSPSSVTIEFSLRMNSRLVKRTASSLFTKAKSAIGKNTFELEERRFDYKQFKIFEKSLMLESNTEYQGKTIEQKLNALSKVFAVQSEINKKTLDTLIRKALGFRLQARSTGDAALSRRAETYEARAESLREFIKLQDAKWTLSEKNELLSADSAAQKKYHRWKTAAKILTLNAAKGKFPSDGWNSDNLATQLRRREAELGVTLKSLDSHKGGATDYQSERRSLTSGKVRKSARNERLKQLGKGNRGIGRRMTSGAVAQFDRGLPPLTREQFFKREAARQEERKKTKLQSSAKTTPKKKASGAEVYKAMFKKKKRLKKMLELGKVDWSTGVRRQTTVDE